MLIKQKAKPSTSRLCAECLISHIAGARQCFASNASLLIQMSIYFQVILDRHCHKSNDLATVAINGACVCNAIHHQFFILVEVKLMAEVFSIIGNWVGMTCCSVSADQPNNNKINHKESTSYPCGTSCINIILYATK